MWLSWYDPRYWIIGAYLESDHSMRPRDIIPFIYYDTLFSSQLLVSYSSKIKYSVSLASVSIMSRYHHWLCSHRWTRWLAAHQHKPILQNILNIFKPLTILIRDRPELTVQCWHLFWITQRVGQWAYSKQITFSVKLSKSNPAINLRFHTFLPPHTTSTVQYQSQRLKVCKIFLVSGSFSLKSQPEPWMSRGVL